MEKFPHLASIWSWRLFRLGNDRLKQLIVAPWNSFLFLYYSFQKTCNGVANFLFTDGYPGCKPPQSFLSWLRLTRNPSKHKKLSFSNCDIIRIERRLTKIHGLITFKRWDILQSLGQIAFNNSRLTLFQLLMQVEQFNKNLLFSFSFQFQSSYIFT